MTISGCIYDVPWYGKCNKEPVFDLTIFYCLEHLQMCGMCKTEKATRGCSMASSLVCGRPLCDTCTCKCQHSKR